MAQHAAKDSPSPGGEGRGEGGRGNKLNAPRREQLELLQPAEKFGCEEGAHLLQLSEKQQFLYDNPQICDDFVDVFAMRDKPSAMGGLVANIFEPW